MEKAEEKDMAWKGNVSFRHLYSAYAAEFAATLLFVFLGAGSVVATAQLDVGMTSARLLAIALAHGFAIAVLVAAVAPISGGHLNPAVTFAQCLTGQMRVWRGAGYVVMQLAGAAAGAWFLTLVFAPEISGTLGAHGLGWGITPTGGFIIEVLLTFALVFVVFATTTDRVGAFKEFAPLAIGLTVLVGHLIGIPVTGASMNPARSFGPALVAGAWITPWTQWLMIYAIGPLIGAAIAAIFYRRLSG
ncbi:MAG: MIP family channel protein [Patescibacteria group bacterium]